MKRLPEDVERRRRRNAKRLLWATLLLSILVVALIAYTSLTAPDPQSRTSEGVAPPLQDEPPSPAQ